MDFLILIGLPGSGKTQLAKTLMKQGDTLLDDAMEKSEKERKRLIEKSKGMIIATDVHECNPETPERHASVWIGKNYPQAKIAKIHFANDRKACIANVNARGDDREVLPTLEFYSSVYCPPDGALPVKTGNGSRLKP